MRPKEGEIMTEQNPEPEVVAAQRAYEAGAAVLLSRARRVVAGRDDSMALFAATAERWLQITPWSELTASDHEFWRIIAKLLNQVGLGVDRVGEALDVVGESAAARREKQEALFAKCGKPWEH